MVSCHPWNVTRGHDAAGRDAASVGPPNIGGKVTPRDGKKCPDTGFTALAQNVRIRTDLLAGSLNLFGQSPKFTKKIEIYSQKSVEAKKRTRTSARGSQ